MRRALALAALALALAARSATYAEPSQREALRARLAQDRVKVRFLQNEEASILVGLEQLEQQIQEKADTSAALEAEIRGAEQRITELTERIVKNQGELSRLRDRFGKRAAALLRLRRARLSRLLRRVRDPNEVRRTRDRFDFVKAWDLDLIRRMLEATAADRKLRFELSEKKTLLVEKKAALDVELEAQSNLRAERKALLTAIRKERVAARRLARELAAAARRLDEQMGRVLGSGPAPDPVPGGFAAQKGRLPWPTVGRLEVAFGKKVDPDSKMVLVSKGIDIRAAQSAPVRAVFEGEVAFVGSKAGFGRLVVLSHAGYYTLYAHLESVAVKAGQSVNGQQVVGYVGDTGSTKGAYLYFEIRAGRAPVDPLRWLSR